MSKDSRPVSSQYVLEYVEAVERTQSLGFTSYPRVIVAKDCLTPERYGRMMSELLRYFDQHTPQELIGQTLSIHMALIPRLFDATGIPFQLTIGWVEFNGKAIFQHDEDTIARFMTEKSNAWQVGDMPFHLWLTSPAFEVVDMTFAMNLGWAKNSDECARLVFYYPADKPQANPIYHPTLVGADFFEHIGMIL